MPALKRCRGSEVRRDALLTVGKSSQLAPETPAIQGKGRFTYFRQYLKGGKFLYKGGWHFGLNDSRRTIGPSGYRDWRLISVAHEEGNLNDLRAILGNDVAIHAFRDGKLPFPEGQSFPRTGFS
jgi:hypothetical protein